MFFCGHCGLQLAPGSRTCPRCGSVTEPELAIEELHINDPTIVSWPNAAPHTPQPDTPEYSAPPQQQKLVLRPDGSAFQQGVPDPNAPTNIISAQARTPVPPVAPDIRTPYHGFAQASGMGYQPAPGRLRPLPTQHPTRRGQGRVVALLGILLVLLLLLGATVVFVVRPGLLKGLLDNNATPMATSTALSSSDQARKVIQRYYDDINKHDYENAYLLWAVDPQHPPAPYNNFVSRFAHTKHDDVTFNAVTPNSDGTVQVDITLHAQEETTSGTVTNAYHLIYLVGTQQGAWRILKGQSTG